MRQRHRPDRSHPEALAPSVISSENCYRKGLLKMSTMILPTVWAAIAVAIPATLLLWRAARRLRAMLELMRQHSEAMRRQIDAIADQLHVARTDSPLGSVRRPPSEPPISATWTVTP